MRADIAARPRRSCRRQYQHHTHDAAADMTIRRCLRHALQWPAEHDDARVEARSRYNISAVMTRISLRHARCWSATRHIRKKHAITQDSSQQAIKVKRPRACLEFQDYRGCAGNILRVLKCFISGHDGIFSARWAIFDGSRGPRGRPACAQHAFTSARPKTPRPAPARVLREIEAALSEGMPTTAAPEINARQPHLPLVDHEIGLHFSLSLISYSL